MIIDYDLKMHYNSVGYPEPDGYIMRFINEKICNDISITFNLKIEPYTFYRTTDKKLFNDIHTYICSARCYTGLFGDDRWPLYALKNKEYWEAIYGEGCIEKEYPLIGLAFWNSCKDMQEYN